jgi:hypothetical protein
VLRALAAGTFEGLTGGLRFDPEHGRIDPTRVYVVDGDQIRLQVETPEKRHGGSNPILDEHAAGAAWRGAESRRGRACRQAQLRGLVERGAVAGDVFGESQHAGRADAGQQLAAGLAALEGRPARSCPSRNRRSVGSRASGAPAPPPPAAPRRGRASRAAVGVQGRHDAVHDEALRGQEARRWRRPLIAQACAGGCRPS